MYDWTKVYILARNGTILARNGTLSYALCPMTPVITSRKKTKAVQVSKLRMRSILSGLGKHSLEGVGSCCCQ